MTPRYYDWQRRLEAFARERAQMPFAWGSNDCANFAADAVEAITGERHFADMRGLDVRAALAFLRSSGGLREIATAALGDPVAPVFARVGDVVVISIGKREALAVCNGTSALAAGPNGIAVVPMDRALCAWKVG